ncbi:DUF3237 domain-containing protein [Spirosoma montaniterrae]|uniref:UPF0311 protein AWR27_00620 n=1 Tax=Spirosoma montaniterrae TaxID=1178516 RepID=A0A1P9WRJ0_9BACT|nr:DUF3237 domain-containing protein [Spirosoma montaniterrae]AQG77982.1 hypothetical protein AWR27_00620 [Spirosoma montaniterrae]
MRLSPAFVITATLGPMQDLGPTTRGHRRIIPITGGTFNGTMPDGTPLRGNVLPGGADWQIVRPDGVAEVEARYTLQTDDGTLILITNRGYRHGPAEVLKRVADGEWVDPAEYYFRTTPMFEVAPGPHDWLGRTVFVATGERRADEVIIRVFAVE